MTSSDPSLQDATVDEWLWLCRRIGAVDDQLPEGKGIHDVELSLMFAWSQMAMIDEIKDRDSYTTMVWAAHSTPMKTALRCHVGARACVCQTVMFPSHLVEVLMWCSLLHAPP